MSLFCGGISTALAGESWRNPVFLRSAACRRTAVANNWQMAANRSSGDVGHSGSAITVGSAQACGNNKLVSRTHMQEREPFVRFPGKLRGVIKTTSDRSCQACENNYRAIAGFSVVAAKASNKRVKLLCFSAQGTEIVLTPHRSHEQRGIRAINVV